MRAEAFRSSPTYRINHPPAARSNLNRNSIIEGVPRRIRPYLGPPGNWDRFSSCQRRAGGCLLPDFKQVVGSFVAGVLVGPVDGGDNAAARALDAATHYEWRIQ